MSSDFQELSIWQRIWYVCAGATAVLAATSINQFPSLSRYQVSLLEWFVNPLYSGWIWAFMALEVTCVVAGVRLLLQGRHKTPDRSRVNWILGFLLLGWISGVAFFVRLSGEIPAVLFTFSLVSIAGIGLMYWFLLRRIELKEELFP